MIFKMTVPQHIKVLKNLSQIMSKAAAYADGKKFEMEVLLQSRLAPDQLNLIRQIQIACDTAKLSASRLSVKEAPVYDDNETTWPQLKTRIENTVKFLETLGPKDFESAETRKISQPRWEGKWMTGFEFVVEHVTPNIYFHVTTAYQILRHNGVEIGKKDYLGELPFKQ